MRVFISIQSSLPGAPPEWKINASFGCTKWKRTLLQVNDPQQGLLPFLAPASRAPGELAIAGLAALGAEDVYLIYQDIVSRQPAQIVEYGQYLFENLLGAVHWKEILDYAEKQGDRLIELALSWVPRDLYLSRLHWEMMHDGQQFLAAGRVLKSETTDVAITRVVAGSTATPRPAPGVPRVLFVIGTSLSDRTIRPGAEIMALLRNPESESYVRASVLENASPAAVKKRVQDFRPEVVHFICHGTIDLTTGGGVMVMKPDTDSPTTKFDATQVWQWLSAGEAPPQIVILSACQTGTVDGDPLETRSVAPLAAELVQAGVPVVIAMSGRVSDLACRLFTRSFARALVRGKTIVAATAKGRRAAIAEGDAPKKSVDWGFPTVFLSEQVPPGYTAASPADDNAWQRRILPYQLRREKEPVFCGRNEFFQSFSELFSNPERGTVLAAYARQGLPGYGRTRLLEELVLQAIREGHMPCAVLGSRPGWIAPKTPIEVALAVNQAMETCRSSLGLNGGDEGPIVMLNYVALGNVTLDELEPWLKKAVRMGWRNPGPPQVNGYALSQAIEWQFLQLMAEARRRNLVSERSRAVLLLDDLHLYYSAFDSIVSERKLDVWGFGTAEEPVPVAATFSLGTPANDLVKPIAEAGLQGWRVLPLERFGRDKNYPEDMQAYSRVLLYPFDCKLAPKFSDVAWVMNYNIPSRDIDECEQKYRDWLFGYPGELKDPKFYMVADMVLSLKKQFLTIATDADQLAQLIKEEKS